MRRISSTPCVPRSMTRDSPPRAPLQVKAQREPMQVLERAVVELARGVLADLGEEHVAHLRQHHRHDAAETVGEDERGGAEREELARALYARRIAREQVRRLLEEDRHGDGDDLGEQEDTERGDDLHAQIGPSRWPHEREQAAQHGPVVGARGKRERIAAGGRSPQRISSSEVPCLFGLELPAAEACPGSGRIRRGSRPLGEAQSYPYRAALASRAGQAAYWPQIKEKRKRGAIGSLRRPRAFLAHRARNRTEAFTHKPALEPR